MVVVWTLNAKQELKRIYEYILKDSYQNAIKVRQEIIDAVLSLPEHPDKYHPDKYKSNNDGTFRSFELYRYRISYRVKMIRSASFGLGIPADHLCYIEDSSIIISAVPALIPKGWYNYNRKMKMGRTRRGDISGSKNLN